MYFRYFVMISPIWTLFTQGCLIVPSLVEIDPVVLEKKMKMWKVYDNANDNNGHILIRKSFDPSAKVS